VPQWAGDVRPPLFQRPTPHSRPHHSQRLHPHRRPHLQPLPRVLWIHSTALSMPRTLGQQTRRSGAAGSTIAGALSQFCHQFSQSYHQCSQSFAQCSRPCHQGRPTHTTVLMVLQIGRRDGPYPKRRGVAGSMARAARTREEAGVCLRSPHHHHMTARLDLPIGWQAGLLRRRRGAARIGARVAHQQLEGAHDQALLRCRRSRHLPASDSLLV